MDLFNRTTVKNTYLSDIKRLWTLSSDTFPDFLKEYSPEEQEKNKIYLQKVIEEFNLHTKKYPRLPFFQKKWKDKTYSILYRVLNEETILNLHSCLSSERLESFVSEIQEFLREVRGYTPELTLDGIGQAMRNYIVYQMFKEIHLDTSGFLKACYGYSMLYPFTDNYIDNGALTTGEKGRYNKLIRDYIMTGRAEPLCGYDEKTLYFLECIRKTYQEKELKNITDLLLMMLDAQEESLRQQKKELLLNARDRLDISLYKGGMSVLIDRFFVKNKMSGADMLFYLGFGFFLQLADDLQDIAEDSGKGSQTLLTLDLSAEQEEKTVNRLFFFIRDLCGSHPSGNNDFLRFVLANCYLLLLMGIYKSREYFTSGYLKKMERFFPVPFSCLETMGYIPFENSGKDQEKLMKIMDTMLR